MISPIVYFSVYGGYASSLIPRGGAGTLYFSYNDTLIIDNGYIAYTTPNGGATPFNESFITTIIATNSAVLYNIRVIYLSS